MIRIPYGKGELTLDIPEGRCRLAEPVVRDVIGPPLEAFRACLAHPTGSMPLEDLAAGRTVTYLIDDATRAEPHEDFIRAVLERLGRARLVRGILATGCHEPLTEGNQRIAEQFRAIAAGLGLRHEMLIHDAEDGSAHVRLGETSRGTPVEVDRRALESDVLVITADAKNHYFAGYSNPLKNFLPGICSFTTTEKNHAFALEPAATFGHHPWHPDPARRSNPVAEDMLEGAAMIIAGRDVFVLASVITAEGVVWCGAGDMEAVTREALGQVDQAATVGVEPARCLIVSPGGHPQDETLYNAQRGLELSRSAVREGGEILFLARCPDGVAHSAKARAEFYDRLTAPLDEVIGGLEAQYVLYSHKAYKFARLLQSVRRLYMVTDLSEEQVGAAHMEKVEDAQQVVDRWLRESDEPIVINARANKVALYR